MKKILSQPEGASLMNSFHERLLTTARPIWDAILSHPFLVSTADGSISERVFKTWMAQDYMFVSEEVPFRGVLISKAPPHLRPPLVDAVAALNRELELFREQARASGVSFDGIEMSPTCHAYVQFMIATAYRRSFAEGFTVLYGVEKAYLDSWVWVKTHQRGPSPWGAFIDNWTSDAFQDYISWLAETLDELSAGKSEADLANMEELFLLTARYEYLFWEMAATGETWPV